jgi:hypothetical protein
VRGTDLKTAAGLLVVVLVLYNFCTGSVGQRSGWIDGNPFGGLGRGIWEIGKWTALPNIGKRKVAGLENTWSRVLATRLSRTNAT